jgi:hypothetical protein
MVNGDAFRNDAYTKSSNEGAAPAKKPALPSKRRMRVLSFLRSLLCRIFCRRTVPRVRVVKQALLMLCVAGCGSTPTNGPSDGGVDASTDAAVDASIDASVDASLDASADASMDASMDAGAQMIECDPIVTLDVFDDGSARLPKLEHSGDHAAVMWQERTNTYEGLVVARYDFSTSTWSEPFDVFSRDDDPPFSPQFDVSIDADGDIVAMWRETIGGNITLWARFYDASQDLWGSPEKVHETFLVNQFAVGYDRSTGQPMVVFIGSLNNKASVLAKKRSAVGWGSEFPLEHFDDVNVATIRLEVNDAGEALVAWVAEPGGVDTVFALPYANQDFRRNGSDVIEAFTDATTTTQLGSVEIALGNGGRGVVTINDYYDLTHHLNAYFVDSLTEFLGPSTVFSADNTLDVRVPYPAIGANDQVAVTWHQPISIGNVISTLWVSQYEAGTWSMEAEVGTGHATVWHPRADIDSSGTISITSSHGGGGIYITRNTGTNGAFLPEHPITGPVLSSGETQVAAHNSGDVLVVWEAATAANLDISASRCR